MTGLLIDDPCVVIQPSLVRALGSMTAAAVLQQLHYWMPRATAEYDGHRWVYKTTGEWADEIGVTVKQARLAIGRLETLGVVLSCQPERGNWQHRKWYRIDYDHPLIAGNPDDSRSALEGRTICPSGPNDLPYGAERSALEGESVTEITSEITSERTTEESPTSSDAPTVAVEVFDPTKAEPERLANLLADLIEENGSKRPTVTKAWVTSIDRMMRLDGRTPEQIENAMRWCQRDTFWRANVLSPDALRKQYDRLRLQAQRQQNDRGPRGLSGVREYLATLETP